MVIGQRLHVDQDGHSITVLCGRPGQSVELLVDGKVVAAVRERRSGLTRLQGVVAGDPPKTFTVYLSRPAGPDGEPLCTLDIDGMRYLMPESPLPPRPAGSRLRPPPATTPAQLLRRLMGRRGCHKHGGQRLRRPGALSPPTSRPSPPLTRPRGARRRAARGPPGGLRPAHGAVPPTARAPARG